MVDVVEFEEAMDRSAGDERTLVVGNGFSARYFTYRNLLERSGLLLGTPPRTVFDALATVDFEAVVRALEGAMAVESAYGDDLRAARFSADAQRVREALVEAVNATHPRHRQDLEPSYVSSAAFLERFSTVFSLNYDLLLYWVNLEKRLLSDGFGLGDQFGSFLGPFAEDAHCNIYNLHGGLHLFDDGLGGTIKALDAGAGVVATITNAIIGSRRFPIYVAEGTSSQKMRKINSVAYLRHCYDALRRNAGTVFVYGHSADDNDAHIYRAIFTSEAGHVYFGVYKPDRDRLQMMDGQLAKFKAMTGSSTGYTFFDSESAEIWPA